MTDEQAQPCAGCGRTTVYDPVRREWGVLHKEFCPVVDINLADDYVEVVRRLMLQMGVAFPVILRHKNKFYVQVENDISVGCIHNTAPFSTTDCWN